MTDVTVSADIRQLFRRKRMTAYAVVGLTLLYLVYVFFAFDIPGLADRIRIDNARTLVSDSYSHKTHVTRNNRTGEITFSEEGERAGTYPEGLRPDWVADDGDNLVIGLPQDHTVVFGPDNTAAFDIPDFGVIEASVSASAGVSINLDPDDLPNFVSYSKARLDIRTAAGRLTVTRSKTEVFRYFFGWELFWFTFSSPYYGYSLFDIVFGPQIDPARNNIVGAAEDFWHNDMWHHSVVAFALLETVLMAFLGTVGAALVALPLAFLAARNFAPLMAIRFGVRRVFDFVRGVDSLIWTIVLSRAFGPGPLTGSLAILFTDTGSFGKLFSEALENVDDKQIEGVSSTGAKPLQRYRFGVIPQVVPVLISQVLYYLESNTRSATIIGAITGGGIGLLLTQAIITQKDWEEVTYYIVLIVIMVIVMDQISGWVRRKIIKGDDAA